MLQLQKKARVVGGVNEKISLNSMLDEQQENYEKCAFIFKIITMKFSLDMRFCKYINKKKL